MCCSAEHRDVCHGRYRSHVFPSITVLRTISSCYQALVRFTSRCKKSAVQRRKSGNPTLVPASCGIYPAIPASSASYTCLTALTHARIATTLHPPRLTRNLTPPRPVRAYQERVGRLSILANSLLIQTNLQTYWSPDPLTRRSIDLNRCLTVVICL